MQPANLRWLTRQAKGQTMAYKFIVTGQIIPHEIGAVVEFDEMPHQGMLHRLQLETATPAEAEKTADEAEPAEAEKPARRSRS